MQATQQQKIQGASKGRSWVGVVILVAGLAVAGWWYNRPGNMSSPVQVTMTQPQNAQEVPGTFKRVDLAAQMQQGRQSQPGTEVRRDYDASVSFIAQAKPALDKALTETSGPVVVIADTSGSMGSDLQKVATTNQYLAGISATRPVTAIYVDDQVRGIEQLSLGYPGVLAGGGVTSYRPGFEYLKEHGGRPGLVIYLTDGLCSTFPADPGYPVLWLLVRPASDFRPPFGVVAGQ